MDRIFHLLLINKLNDIRMKINLILALALILSLPLYAQTEHVIRDEQGRQLIPRGFVINTEDSQGDIYYTPDD